MRRRLTAIAATVALIVPIAAPVAAPPAYAGDSAAVAINTRDDSTVFRLMLDIARVMADTVDTSNAAVAVASCNSCETVAIAIQVVLATGSPTVIIPENLALAMNIDCDACATLAEAFQYVYTTGGPVHFTADGSQRIAEIRRELEALRNAGLSIDEIAARVEELNRELQQVLLTEVVPAGSSEAGSGSATDTGAAPTDTGAQPTQTDTTTGTTPTTTDTGTQTTPSDTGTGDTTTTDTTTSTTPTDTGTQTTPGG